jgi:hypothetical protein
VVDFLKDTEDSRAVVGTASRFGWNELWVDCVCLYVDADSTTDLETSVASQGIPTIIVKVELRSINHSIETAKKLLGPPRLDRVAISKRRFGLRANAVQRAISNVGPFCHGQSISLLGRESKGSVSVFLSPDGLESDKVYALTAYHVLPFKTDKESRVITPGGLDILSRLHDITKSSRINNEALDFLIERWGHKCGDVKYGHIGTNGNGWRSDWDLLQLNDEWKGVNGSWFDTDEMSDLSQKTEERNPDFTGRNGVINNVDAIAGDICYMDGACTGCAVGVIGPSTVLMFQKGTAFAVTEEELASNQLLATNVDRSRLLTFHSGKIFCKGGDSGSGVFCPDTDNDSWNWVGQIVSVILVKEPLDPWSEIPPNLDDLLLPCGVDVGLMIPQSEILQSLKENTGIAWHLSV